MVRRRTTRNDCWVVFYTLTSAEDRTKLIWFWPQKRTRGTLDLVLYPRPNRWSTDCDDVEYFYMENIQDGQRRSHKYHFTWWMEHVEEAATSHDVRDIGWLPSTMGAPRSKNWFDLFGGSTPLWAVLKLEISSVSLSSFTSSLPLRC